MGSLVGGEFGGGKIVGVVPAQSREWTPVVGENNLDFTRPGAPEFNGKIIVTVAEGMQPNETAIYNKKGEPVSSVTGRKFQTREVEIDVRDGKSKEALNNIYNTAPGQVKIPTEYMYSAKKGALAEPRTIASKGKKAIPGITPEKKQASNTKEKKKITGF
jgi:hypothetical protein